MRIAMNCAAVVACAALVSGPGVPAARGEAAPAEYQRFLAEKAPAIVTIKYILKIEGGGMGESGDQEVEISGVMIDAKGLVLTSSTQMGGIAAMLARLGRESIKATPTEIKVLIGDDTQGVEGKLLARDSEIDLAWVQIDKPSEKPYVFVDLANSASPQVGDSLYSVHRLSKFFDRAAHVAEGRLGGTTKKPRTLLVDAMGNVNSLGLPVYDASGKVVGVTTLILPEAEEMESMAGGMFGSGQRELFNGMILPAADVLDATKRARESGAKPAAAEEKAEGAKLAPPGEKKDEPAPK